MKERLTNLAARLIKKISANKKASYAILGLVTAAVLTVMLAVNLSSRYDNPRISLKCPYRVSISKENAFIADVNISSIPENTLYPAASIAVSFDTARLNFVGLSEGNMLVTSPDGQSLPEWKVNIELANETGIINALYLDETAGQYAYTKKGFDPQKRNLILRLNFQLRGGAIPGDICNLIFKDACFAASDSSKSLSMVSGTLSTVDGTVIIDE